MALVSLKTEDEMPSRPSSAYGYGTCLYLTDDQCEALGIKEGTVEGLRAEAMQA